MLSRNPELPRSRGFTLIELLVVVAIIALLISILLPSLQRAKRQARQLVCCTNLRSQGQAAYLYADDNGGRLPRGSQGVHQVNALYPGYNSFATSILTYLGWSGSLHVKVGGDKIYDVPARPWDLWRGMDHKLNDSPYKADWWKVQLCILAEMQLLQCPDYPQGLEVNENEQWIRLHDGRIRTDGSPLDYVASAMPIPYNDKNINADQGGDMSWDPEGGWEGVDVNATAYMETSNIEDFPAGASPAALIYVTEGHTSLPYIGSSSGTLFHHFFVGMHLPFAGRPRIANDQRHPGGLDALFFDGHAATLDLHQIDPAWPNPLALRLKWFTVMPDTNLNP
jgi:prepilin-type N-terminal cleavage/methylation domain-containing protein/prepilin-type processing-associated H-X9-DG protein